MDYSAFDIADFAADAYFVSWVLQPNEETDAFWNAWSASHPEKSKTIHEARLLVLLMQSRRLRLDDARKEDLWDSIQRQAFEDISENAPAPAPEIKHRNSRVRVWFKAAAAVFVAAALSYVAFERSTLSHTIVQNPKGKKSEIYLPDGTKVWLNAESRISYPASFDGLASRAVTLEGEAFFDVTENPHQPFVVHTTRLQVKVLGTAFNVRSYKNDPTIETTLVRGKVMIELNEKDRAAQKPVVLKERQQAVYSVRSKELSLSNVETAAATYWKEGKLMFINKPFSDIEEELERWYGVEIRLEDEGSRDCRFSTTIENEPIQKILELFEKTSGTTYTVDGNLITLKGRLCP